MVINFIKDHQMQSVDFHGCMFGLKSRSSGLPIKKPWTIVSNSSRILHQLRDKKCRSHPEHAPCEGSDTKATEEYTDSMARSIHDGFYRHCSDYDVDDDEDGDRD